MRLFVAIDLTSEVRAAIAGVQKRVAGRTKSTSLRLVRPEHLHMTLVFIGEVDDAASQRIVECMTVPIEQQPFEIAFGGIGVFPHDGAPRVLWLGVTEGAGGAVALQRAVADRLETVGIEREQRPFSPHLTLARWRDGKRSDARRVLEPAVGLIARLAVNDVTLYQSRLSPSGPTYTPLVCTRLGPGAVRTGM